MYESIMPSRLAAKLDEAFEASGWSSEDVEKLCENNILTEHLNFLNNGLVGVFRYLVNPHRLFRIVPIKSPGQTGMEWLNYLKQKNIHTDTRIDLLLSKHFKPTPFDSKRLIVLIKREILHPHEIIPEIKKTILDLGLKLPTLEDACILRNRQLSSSKCIVCATNAYDDECSESNARPIIIGHFSEKIFYGKWGNPIIWKNKDTSYAFVLP